MYKKLSRSALLFFFSLALSLYPSISAVAQEAPRPTLSEADLKALTENLLQVKKRLLAWDSSLTTREAGLTSKERELSETETLIAERERDLQGKEQALIVREKTLSERELALQENEKIIPSLQDSLTNALAYSAGVEKKVNHLEFDLFVWKGVAVTCGVAGGIAVIIAILK